MKTLLKVTLVAALMCVSSSAFAQKFGYINVNDLVILMPEYDSAVLKLQAMQKELSEQLQTIEVEYNNKVQDLQKNQATLSDAVKEMKNKEIVDVQQRYGEMQQMAQQQVSKMQNDLMTPIIDKAQAAIDKISKESGFTLVFNSDVISYFNPTTVVDVMPLVKKELNLKDKPAADAAAATTTPAAATTPAAK